jgi:2-dehydro-3-deoxyphosphogluconate aldolase/(4S)-4-hydroxy-2-oxoglutarate aldolase
MKERLRNMMSEQILQQILDSKIVAIVRGVKPEEMLATAKALLDGGVKCLEVTFDQTNKQTIEQTLTSLRLLKENYSQEILLGAGTVVSVEQVDSAVAAGAEYIISPNTNPDVIKRTKSLGKISIPGALTPSESVLAYESGADIVKLFPAGVLGTAYIKALVGPLSYIPFVAVGGVNENNVAEFIKAGAKGVGVGGNLVSVKDIRNGDFHKLTECAKKYIQNLRG